MWKCGNVERLAILMFAPCKMKRKLFYLALRTVKEKEIWCTASYKTGRSR
jgi:hypothetical protein